MEVVGCTSENEVETLDGSLFDLGVSGQEDGQAHYQEVKTETDLSSRPSTFGGIKSSSDSNLLSESDSSNTAFKLLIFLFIAGTRNSRIWEKPKPETSLYPRQIQKS